MGSSWNSRQPARDKYALDRIKKRYNLMKSKFADNDGKWFESLPRTIADREKAFVKEMKE